jgi:CubicO group peptidase (beta-lactamase class C family)
MRIGLAGGFALLCSLASTVGCTGGSENYSERLDSLAPWLLTEYRGAGLAVALIEQGEVVSVRGYGVADKAQRLAITPDTVFYVASVSKSVSAWGVLRLVEQGKLDLDAPASRYLKRWRIPPSRFDSDQVTIRRLLCHAAGLAPQTATGYAPDALEPTLEQTLDESEVRLVIEPGSRFHYTNGGYTVLQLVVEEVSGSPFAVYMQEEILGPLGMKHSGFEWAPAAGLVAATAYDKRGKPLAPVRYSVAAGAGLRTTAADLGRFVAAAMPGPAGEPPGRGVLRPQSIEQLFTPTIEIPFLAPLHYGLGYNLHPYADGSMMTYHQGDLPGWKTVHAALPRQRRGIVVLSNSDRGRALPHVLVADWTGHAGVSAPQSFHTVDRDRRLARLLALVLWLGLAGWGWRIASDLFTGRRWVYWSFSLPGWRKTIRLIPALLLLLLAGALAFSLLDERDLFEPAPGPARAAALAALLWCVLLTLTVLAPRARKP